MATIYVTRPPVDDFSKGQPKSNVVPATILALLAAFPVARPPYWKYHFDSGDSALWQGTPNQEIPPLRLPAGGNFPLRPHFWPNNYDDSSYWVGTPNRSIPETDEPAGGGIPFKPPYWKYNYDDPGFWVGGKSVSIFQVNLFSNFVSGTDKLQLPVNCVLIGDQVYEPGQYPLAGNLFKSIFKE